ncbi:hypothetical protein D6827_00035 [Candidatus Parcubacteria bacterium]|nr:MAG: hypothetical protein D6827_00035 [Candidatus Parcubacteria bacterium]
MRLDLNIDKLAGPGRPAKALSAEVVGALNAADIELLANAPKGVKAAPIKRLTDRHHALARLLASGMPENEAALTLNYTQSHVSILKQSPAFQELLALYRRDVDAEFVSMLENMAGLGRDALLELRDRLEEKPDRFTNKELLAILTDIADRVDVGESRDKLPQVIELVPKAVEDGDGES